MHFCLIMYIGDPCLKPLIINKKLDLQLLDNFLEFLNIVYE